MGGLTESDFALLDYLLDSGKVDKEILEERFTDSLDDPLFRNGLTIEKFIKNEIDINKTKALLKACQSNNLGLTEILLQNGASPNASLSTNSLFYACKHGSTKMVDLLLQAGANANSFPRDIEVCRATTVLRQDAKSYMTIPKMFSFRHPITYVISKNDPNAFDIVKMLVKAGAGLNIKDGGGYTPLSWALKVGRIDIARYLVANSAQQENS